MFFRYVLRGLFARRSSTVPTALAIVATIGAITAMLGLLEGLFTALNESGHPNTVMVLAVSPANDELSSKLSIERANEIAVAPGIRRADGTSVVSGELVTSYRFRNAERGFEAVTVRGVTPPAFELRPEVKVTSGRFPASGEIGLVIGSKRAGRLDGFAVGSTVRIGRKDWPVLGVLEAPGTVAESEVWADRSALMTELKRTDSVSVVYARIDDEASLPALEAAVARDKSTPIRAVTERGYYRQSLASVDLFARAIMIMTAVLALGAIFAAINTMYTAFLGRLPELGTLVAIGYTRRRVSFLLVQESLALAFLSGAVGIGLALLAHGRTVSFEASALVYSAKVSPRVIAAGLAATLLIGLAGSVFAVFHTLRMRVLEALRA
jgi:putative ABC transport system permease protein